DLQILNPQIDKEYLKEKGVILDVRARDSRGCQYNIEVQVTDEPSYVERAVFYLARLFGGQLEQGEHYTCLAKTIGISLVDFELFPDMEDLHSTYRFHDAAHHRDLTDILEMHFVELPKFTKDKPHVLRTPFEKWLHVLKFGELYESGLRSLPEALRNEEGIEMALDAMKQAWCKDEVREMIEFRKKALWDEASRLERSRREGKAEGKAEVACRMRNLGFDLDSIVIATGLRKDEIPE
ncbi:MAG: Rpn family recombination-promoting nuclease/putative transposase, partial [Desulfomonile tiedjei]|nr:Rpn family recombination-promoting nuclease/putative transposase [Desulfomonile tiedjei]